MEKFEILTVLGLYSQISAQTNVKFCQGDPSAKFHVYRGNVSPLRGKNPFLDRVKTIPAQLRRAAGNKLQKICKRVRRRRQDVAECKDVIGPACLVDSLTVIQPLQVVRRRISHTLPGSVWFIRPLREKKNFDSLGKAIAPFPPSPPQMARLCVTFSVTMTCLLVLLFHHYEIMPATLANTILFILHGSAQQIYGVLVDFRVHLVGVDFCLQQ